MRQGILVLGLLAFAWSSTAQAADAERKYAPKGVGLAKCSRFVQEFEARSANADQFIGWINGYLTAYNQFAEDTFDITSWEDSGILGIYLNQNCKRFPDVPFARAVQLMVKALEKDRLTAADDMVEATAGEQKVRLYKGTLQRVQEKLAELDFYKGEADGTYGDKTRFAITEFQQARGINVTGVPDQMTLMHLLRPGNS